MKAAAKGVILSNDIATKLNEAGLYDENVRAKIGNEISAKLNIKDGGIINLDNFKNADKVVSQVLSNYGIKGNAPAAEPERSMQISPEIAPKLNTLGLTPEEQQKYMALTQKQR